MSIAFPGGLIRPWRLADAKALQVLADNRKVWLNLLDRFPHPYAAKDAKAWVRFCAARRPATDFAVEADGHLAGGIGLLPGGDVHAGTAEIGYWLGEAYWGRGLGTAMVGAFTEHAFADLRLRRVFAKVFDWNPASGRVLEKCGYRLEGRLRASAVKDGKIVDELLYARLHE